MSWFLFEHPKHDHFHYRISQSWLSEGPPPEIVCSLTVLLDPASTLLPSSDSNKILACKILDAA
jgi:hypothetical protein